MFEVSALSSLQSLTLFLTKIYFIIFSHWKLKFFDRYATRLDLKNIKIFQILLNFKKYLPKSINIFLCSCWPKFVHIYL